MQHVIMQGSQGRNSSQEPGRGKWCKGYEEMLLTGLLSLFSYTARTTSPQMASTKIGWAFPYQASIKKNASPRLTYRPVLRRHFLN